MENFVLVFKIDFFACKPLINLDIKIYRAPISVTWPPAYLPRHPNHGEMCHTQCRLCQHHWRLRRHLDLPTSALHIKPRTMPAQCHRFYPLDYPELLLFVCCISRYEPRIMFKHIIWNHNEVVPPSVWVLELSLWDITLSLRQRESRVVYSPPQCGA